MRKVLQILDKRKMGDYNTTYKLRILKLLKIDADSGRHSESKNFIRDEENIFGREESFDM